MGNRVDALLERLFDYPIKRKPICFYRQEDFASTDCSKWTILGEPLPREEQEQKGPPTEYDKLVQSFYTRLLNQRRNTRQLQEKDRRDSVDKVMRNFPGWNEMTISNLHNLFLLFDNNINGMLGFDEFCAILESLGDESSSEMRKQRFDEADSDMDGWINYDEFLSLVYHFTPPQAEDATGLGKICYEVSENIRFISNMSVGEQLEYGIF